MNSDIANSSAFGSASYILTANIDMTGQSWTPIGSFGSQGVFDGQGHTISNLSIGGTTSDIAMFGTSGGAIENVRFDNVQVQSTGSGTNFIGAVVGWMSPSGSLTNVSAIGSVIAGKGSGAIGGLVGINWGTITKSYALGSVSGGYAVGGLAGQNAGSINNSYADETITATGGTGQAGGIAGFSEGAILNTYEVGSISSAGSAGGIVGLQYNPGTVTSSYWDMTVNPSLPTNPSAGTPATTAQLQDINTFNSWDFTSIWGINQNPNWFPVLTLFPFASNSRLSSSPFGGNRMALERTVWRALQCLTT